MDGQNIWLTKKKIGISSGFFMGIWEYHGNRMGISWDFFASGVIKHGGPPFEFRWENGH